MLEFKDKVTIFHTVVNIIIIAIVIYSSTQIVPEKNDNDSKDYNNSSTNLSHIEEKIIFNQSLSIDNIQLSNFRGNRNKNKNNAETDNFWKNIHWPLFSTGAFSVLFASMLIFSFFVEEQGSKCDCCDDCDLSSNKSNYGNEACCCGTCLCCACCCGRGCCDCGGGHSRSRGKSGDGEGCAILLAIILFIFILFYYLTKSLGRSVSRVVALITLLLFDCIFTILGIIQGTKEEMNTYSYLVIIFGVIGIVNNLIGLICKYFYSKKSYISNEFLI